MKDHYTALVHSGFLSKASQELDVARTYLKGTEALQLSHDFMWYFDKKQKKAVFNDLYEDLDVAGYVTEAFNAGAKPEDVIVLSSPDFLILCAQKKSIVTEAATEHYSFEGIIPYYTTKRTINGKVHWFTFSWLTIPFTPPNFN